MAKITKLLSGWGRYPVQSCELERPERYAELHSDATSLISRGQGRSYGDAALNENGRVLLTERINRFLEFDLDAGIVRAEAGVTLVEMLEMIVPLGWFLPVTPGTKFVSLGGCVAADVHGKNHHHAGSFGDHVLSIELLLANGNNVTCTPDDHPELFWATVGGMGLTGIISEITLKLIPLQSAYIKAINHAAGNFEQLFQALCSPSIDDRYSVAWIDTLATGKIMGRGIVMCGHHAKLDELPGGYVNPFVMKPKLTRSVPFHLPGWALNPTSIRTFNSLYFHLEGRKGRPFLCGYDSYFYPLDAISQWNRLYGKRGFVQYQCVIPEKFAFDGIKALLQEVAGSHRPSFLAVLKRLGAQGRGMLSFPTAGYTLALDLPIHDQGLFAFLDELDEIVLRHGGRVYLAKDARLSAANFRKMYPRFEEWLKIKNSVDPGNRFRSSLSRRLQIAEGVT